MDEDYWLGIGADPAFAGNSDAEQPYLRIEEIRDVEPLDSQFGTLPKKTVPDVLYEPFFGQSDPTEAEIEKFGSLDAVPQLKTYAILDAAKVPNLPEILEQSGLAYRCLFKGGAAEELKKSAPYLVDMSLGNRSGEEPAPGSPFHRNFFRKYWGKNVGILLRTTASMDEIWSHLRKFTRLQVEQDKRWVFFRYWDPQITPCYFDSIRDLPQKIVQWLYMRDDQRVALIAGDQPESQNAWLIRPCFENLVGVKAKGIPVLSDVELDGFERFRAYRYETRAMAFFRDQFPQKAAALTDDSLRQVVRIASQKAKAKGIASEKDQFKYLIAVAFLGCYFEDDSQYRTTLTSIGWFSENERAYAPYMAGLTEVVSAHVADIHKDLARPKRILLGFERIYSSPSDQLTYDHIRGILSNIWPTRCQRLGVEQVNAFISQAGGLAQHRFNLSGSDLVAYVVAAMYFGSNFGGDPLFPWASQAIAQPNVEKGRHQIGAVVFDIFANFWKEMK
ncbi:DUF4123 domain-containing protein [Thioclava sp. GXIMD4216]|uniref:DUF4123 domain-containing protein n=1 Tax=Thioclava sp. GXIMD4216 TaxID=3131929 RepID=UPI0030D17413